MADSLAVLKENTKNKAKRKPKTNDNKNKTLDSLWEEASAWLQDSHDCDPSIWHKQNTCQFFWVPVDLVKQPL